MSFNYVLPSLVSKSAIQILEENLVIGNLCFRGDNSAFLGGMKCGDTVSIRKPATFTVNEFTAGNQISTQTVNETSTSITLEKHFDTSIEVGAREQTLSLEDFNEQVTKPVMIEFANKIDTYLLGKYVDLYNVVGDASQITGLDDIADVVQRLDEGRIPATGRVGFITPQTKADLLKLPEFTRVDASGRTDAFREAMVGRTFGIDWYSTTNISSHAVGTPGGTPAASGSAGASAVTIASGGNAGTYKRGDVVSFAGITSTTFVVTEDLELTALGAGSLKIYPVLPSTISSALVTQVSCTYPNIVGNPRALSFVIVPLEAPLARDTRASVETYRGISVRVVSDYNITYKKSIISFDLLCGARMTDPRLMLRWNRK